MRASRILVIGLLCVGIVAGGITYRAISSSGEGDEPTSLAEAFSVFERAPRPLPTRLQRQVEASMGKDRSQHLDFNRAHRANAASGVAIWALATRRKVCIVEAGRGAISCLSRGAAIREGVALGVALAAYGKKPRLFRVFGLVPDAFGAVVLRVLGSGQRTVVVQNNVYTYSAQAPIAIVSLTQ